MVMDGIDLILFQIKRLRKAVQILRSIAISDTGGVPSLDSASAETD